MRDFALKIRAAQLDLARQKETLETIRDFIRFASSAGYNTLLLYLEAIVRTKSFNELPESMTYSADEICQIVASARQAGMEVVPCISTLAHAEHFFKVERMKPLAEQLDGQRLMTFCLSNPQTYSFLEQYLSEIADLFPAPHLHVGMDECWQIGRCSRCQPRVRQDGNALGLLIDHIQRIHGIVTKLGKRMWMWNDMLEFAADEQLAQVPRDILMCMWNYSSQAIHRTAGIQGHFDELLRHDTLAHYTDMGFEVLISPGAGGSRNIYEMTQYARRHRCAGGLMTIWELGGRFLSGTLPAFLFGGLLWKNPSLSEDEAVEQMIDRLFPGDLSAIERQAIAAGSMELPAGALHPDQLLRGPLSLYEHHQFRAASVYEKILEGLLRRPDISLQQTRILQEMWIRARTQRIARQFHSAQQELVDPASPDKRRAAATVRGLVQELRALAEFRSQQWGEQRPGIAPEKAGAALHRVADAYMAVADTWAQSTDGDYLLELDLFLWDCYRAPIMKVELLHGNSSTFVAEGSFKPLDLRQSQYTVQFPIRLDPGLGAPDAVRMTVRAYGGQGVRFVRLLACNGHYEPGGVLATSGEVQNPEAALLDQSTVCYLGSTHLVATLLSQTDHLESSLTLRPAGGHSVRKTPTAARYSSAEQTGETEPAGASSVSLGHQRSMR